MKTPNQEQQFDQTVARIPQSRRGKNLNGFFAGAATMLVLGAGGFLLYQGMDLGQANLPFNLPINRNRSTVTPSPASDISPSPTSSLATPSNPYVQSALANKAQVELLSVKRIPEMPDEVTVEFRVNRIADKVATSDIINIGATKARNPVTNETYKSVDPENRSSGPIALFTLRQGQPLDGYVVLKVPRGITLIDVFLENGGAFKNVLVADAEPALQLTPPLATPTPTTGTSSLPTPTVNPSISPFGKAPAIQETIPIPGTRTPVFPSPKTTTIAPEGVIQPLDSSSEKPDNKGAKREDIRGQNTPAGNAAKKAFGNKAQVQLLSVQRLENYQTGKRDLVTVQMRVSRLADNVGRNDVINIPQISARNSVSNAIYKSVPVASSTGSIALNSIPRGQSVDASVALKVPEGVQVVDISVPETGTFQEVEIVRSTPVEGP
ncbi:MAG TPA: hypothetical protein DDW76_34405 [Cyanobacteria bacterium UBA11369]|nr:hypothetical protein [Cyanobacteria bacterium UBA11371]HBE32077.1 hypothetical protein [Cyanobacteria bacterium UBA11368]HBE53707.1 hypothetical protein [Cyanobacteria bacterium UBA11369]